MIQDTPWTPPYVAATVATAASNAETTAETSTTKFVTPAGLAAYRAAVPGPITAATGQAATLTGGDSGASLVLGAGTSAKGVFTGGSATGMTLDLVRTTGTAVANTTFAQINGYNGASNRAAIIDLVGAGAADSGQIDFYTKATGAGIANAARLTSTGNLLIGTATDMSGSGGVKIGGTTASTSPTTGALQVAGGVGIAGNVTSPTITHTPASAPASPASGWVIYVDSGDGNKLKAKSSTGTVVTIGTP